MQPAQECGPLLSISADVRSTDVVIAIQRPTPLNATHLAAFSSTAAAAGMAVSIWIGVESLDKNSTAMASGRKSPLATKNLLEDTDGLRRPP